MDHKFSEIDHDLVVHLQTHSAYLTILENYNYYFIKRRKKLKVILDIFVKFKLFKLLDLHSDLKIPVDFRFPN